MTDAETIAETLDRLDECGIALADASTDDDASADVVAFLSSELTAQQQQPPGALVTLGTLVYGVVEAMERCGASRAECEDVKNAYEAVVSGMKDRDAGKRTRTTTSSK